MRKTSNKMWVAVAGAASIAMLATACSSGDGDSSDDESTASNKPVTLTIATFNDFGYSDELFAEYTKAHPNVTVKQTKAAKSEDAHTNLVTKLGAGGEGLADIEAIEIDWLPELRQAPDEFVDLADPSVEGRWSDAVVGNATLDDGKLIGYGTDTGPEAICYRQDLLKAAGLPSDPEAVAAAVGTWDDYFALGTKFVAASDSAWFDSGVATYQGMINQVKAAYENPKDGTPTNLKDNAEIKKLYDKVTSPEVQALSAKLDQWSPDWDAAFQSNGFATMLCPSWMTGPIEERAGGVTGWNIANAFPGGGGNWGGSYLTVPASGKHTAEAKELAAWLTSPEIQTKAFIKTGNFPSQLEAQKSDEVQSAKAPFFNDAPKGAIFTDRIAAIDVIPFKGPNYFKVHQTVQDGIKRVEYENVDPAASWQTTLSDFSALGL
ncbi:ABC transporter substrate-binding protein [Cellulomonas sp. URHD0024]|uniref:ABC transporter substrate-binding protein n=1 Tax=Cellulomonas sp. URHD0024 TaxID=1302620 RepID=UPI000420EC89|nr:extracellular solute-binding protein [Cellulomonas sp. URHD0024]